MLDRINSKFKWVVLSDHSEQENLKVLSFVDDEINLTKMVHISEDEIELIKGTSENTSNVEYKKNVMKLDRHQLKEETSKVKKSLGKIDTKKLTIETKSKESWWKRRIKNDIRRDNKILERWKKDVKNEERLSN